MPAPASAPTCPRPLALAFVGLLALAAQAWILRLPFQLDDYGLLAEPFALFGLVPTLHGEAGQSGVPPYMLRWTLWALWGVVATLSPTPLQPLPFHLVGLVLHAAVSILLACGIARSLPAPLGARAGILAGCFFALSTGGIQAVSWTAAQSDLLFPLFALLSWNAFLKSPASEGSTPLVWGAFWLLLALLSKAPALVLVPGLALLLLLRSRGDRVQRFPARELVLLATVTLLAFLARWLYLGTFELRYQDTTAPGPGAWLSTTLRGFQAVGQALYPWNAHPLVADEAGELFLARLAEPLGLGAPAVGLGLLLLLALPAAVFCKAARLPLLTAALLLALFALPAALLYRGLPTNVVGRTTYLALLPAWGAAGIACAALASRSRAGAILAIALTTFVLVEGRAHVSACERLAAEELDAHRALVDEALRPARDEGVATALIQITPGESLAGIPLLGRLAPDALRPPFSEEAPVICQVFRNPDALQDALPDLELGERRLIVLGPDPDWFRLAALDPPPTAAEQRALRRLRPWGEERAGLPAADLVRLGWRRAAAVPGSERWEPSIGLPRHAAPVWSLTLPPGPDLEGTLEWHGAGATVTARVGALASDDERRLIVAPFRRVEDCLGPPIAALVWNADQPLAGPPAILASLPALQPSDPPAEGKLILDPTHPPTFVVEPPPVRAPYARLELTLLSPTARFPVYCDLELEGGPGAIALPMRKLFLDGRRAPSEGKLFEAPWALALTERLLPELHRRGRTSMPAEWRLSLLHPDGSPAARTPRTPITIQLP